MASPPDVATTAKSLLPSFSANVILYIIITVVVVLLIGWAFYALFKKMKYDLTFVIWQDVNGKPQIVDKGTKGMLITIGKTGEKVFHIPKYNKYLPPGSKQTGTKTYWYYIDSAQKWHNIGVDFIDVKKRNVQLNMQLQMDFARDGINKRLEDRHNKPGWWEKWGMIAVSITVIAILLIFIWLAFKDALSNNQQAQTNLQLSQKVQVDLTNKFTALLTAMDNVCSGRHIDVSTIINQTNQVT